MAKLTREDVEQIVKEAREQGERPNLSGAKLERINLNGADLNGVDLSRAKLYQAKLSRAQLNGPNLHKARLIQAKIGRAQLEKADLSQANLRKAIITGSNLSGTDLSEANLTEANIDGVDFSKANLSGANLSNAVLASTMLVSVDLARVYGLETVKHYAPSTIDMNTIYQSQDKIPKIFLEGAGVHPDIIRWQHSLHTRPTVFISYNHKDEQEKEQLLAHLSALQRNDFIDIWHDARIPGGADWKEEIKQAMARASVAILLISANFLASDFIFEEEIPTFLKRQKSAEKLHIYPIIAKPCNWQAIDWLAEMQVRPKGGNPIWGKGADPDAELAQVANEITEIIKELMFK